VPVPPAGELTAVYEVIVAPPLLAGAVKSTVAVVCPVAVAVPIVGAPGTVGPAGEFDLPTEANPEKPPEIDVNLLIIITSY
jgi:hypothetical protein